MQLDLPLVAESCRIAASRSAILARAFKTLAFALTIALSLSSTAVAKRTGGKVFNKITDINAVTITVSIGVDGNTHQTYSITDNTKVTLNGAPSNARDLRAGMIAHVVLSADGRTATIINGRDAPAHPGGHRNRTG